MSRLALAQPARSGTEGAEPARAAAVFAVLCAMALVVLDAGVVQFALPALGAALGASPARSLLAVTAYQAGLMMALAPAGALGERFRHRRVFAAGLATFAAGSALCALAPSLAWLTAARLMQGFGGAAVMALGVALLRFSVPQGRLGAAIGWNALTVALASAAAPSLGALILAAAGWRGLFAASLPMAALALWASRALPPTPRGSAPLDAASMLLSAAAFASVILAAEFALEAPAFSAAVLAAGVGALVLLVRRERPKAAPLIALDLLVSPSFRLSIIASVACFTAQTGGLLALTFQLQHGFGLSPAGAGLILTAWPATVAIAAVAAGRLADRLPSAGLCAAGAGLLAIGLAGAAACRPPGDPRLMIPFAALCGAGFGLFQTPNNRNLFLAAPAERSGAAGGAQGSARVTGQTLGALSVALLFGAGLADGGPSVALALSAVLALAAGLVSLLRGAR
jgi:DHA2 family multidrug resistance protein-like MFS transporter